MPKDAVRLAAASSWPWVVELDMVAEVDVRSVDGCDRG
jgi:hypothetical protein